MTRAGLEIRQAGRLVETVVLDRPRTRIGRQSDNDVVLPNVDVSRQHAEIRVEGTEHVLHDLGSSNGLSLNGAQVGRAVLVVGDEVAIGGYRLRFVLLDAVRVAEVEEGGLPMPSTDAVPGLGGMGDAPDEAAWPWQAGSPGLAALAEGDVVRRAEPQPPEPWRDPETHRPLSVVVAAAGQDRIERLLAGDELGIGRDPGNQICLSSPEVSRIHAVLRRDGAGRIVIEDIESRLGVVVGGVAVRGSTLVTLGEVIEIGAFELVVGPASPDAEADARMDGPEIEHDCLARTVETSLDEVRAMAAAVARRQGGAHGEPGVAAAPDAVAPIPGTAIPDAARIQIALQHDGWAGGGTIEVQDWREAPAGRDDHVVVRLVVDGHAYRMRFSLAEMEPETAARPRRAAS